jgi:type III secretion protein V
MIRDIKAAVHREIGDLPATAQKPVLLVSRDIRYHVKTLLDSEFPDISVLSYEQLTPQIRVQPLALIAAGGA